MSLRRALATPDGKRRYTRWLFATIADRYDFITGALSCGLDRRWKRRLVSLAGVRQGDRALDLACGTGDITLAIAARGGRAVGLDVTPRMIEIARRRPFQPTAGFVVGDMMALPLADRSFDLVTAGYGFRNVPALEPAIRESFRVLRPGGRLLSLDFDRPDNPVVRSIYLAYLTAVGSFWGFVLHGRSDTYRYIPATIRRYPGSAAVAALMREAGFAEAEVLPVLGGLLTIHVARKA